MLDWTPDKPLRLTVDGAVLEARAVGPAPASAPTIVLLHEGLGCVALWRDVPERLAAATGCGVFAYSRQGYGGSDPCDLPRPLDYMTDEAVRVLPQVLDGIGFRRGVLVGHSDGASIAALHAGLVGDRRVAGIVLMAPHFFTEPQGLASIAEAKAAYDQGDLRDRLARYHSHVDNTFRGWNYSWLNPDFEAWNIEAPLADVGVPVLAIQGKQDQYGTRAQITAVEDGVPGAVQVAMLDDCRHAPFIDQPQRTLDLIAEFVAAPDVLGHASEAAT